MGAPDDIFAALSAAGLTAAADGDRLLVTPADRITPDLRETIRANKWVILAALRPASRWVLHFPDAEPLIVTVDPPEAHAQVLARYPGAAAAEPLVDPALLALPAEARARIDECIAAKLYDDVDRPILAAMHAADSAGTSELVEAMHDRIGRCYQCRHFSRPGLADGYCGGRSDLEPAYGPGHPLRVLPADGGANCTAWIGR